MNYLRKRYKIIINLIFVLFMGVMAIEAGLPENSESDIENLKAAFIYNFTKYITWPDMENRNTFKIGVIGDSEIAKSLGQIASKKQVNNKPIKVYRIHSVQDFRDCQILFVSSSEKDRISEILSALGQKTILTIGDTPGFCEYGIMINFFIQGGLVKFEMNSTRLERVGLKARSQLRKLARIVE